MGAVMSTRRWSSLENLTAVRWAGLLLTAAVTALALLITFTHIWVHRRARFSVYTNFTTVTMSLSCLVILVGQIAVVMPALLLSVDGFYNYEVHPVFKTASTLSDASFCFATYFTFVLVVRRVFIAVKNRRLRRTHRMMMLFSTVMFSLVVLACAAWAECFLRFDQEGVFFYRVLREPNYSGWLVKAMLDIQAPVLFTLDILLLILRRMCRVRKKTAQLLGEGSAATITAGNRGGDDAVGYAMASLVPT
ncbi:hypothetical protein AAVH_01421 [Aphelenchoides avenae]|nr:hypothetical protein AAVH_01421 [Aphelenchus avenae]